MNLRRMTSIIAASVTLCLTGAVQGHNTLRLFLAERGLSNPDNPNSPSLAPALVNPVLAANGAATRRLYVWAQLHNESENTVWHGVGFNVRTTGQTLITYAVMYNANSTVLSGSAQRWEGVMAPMTDTSGNQTRWSGANGVAGLLSAGLQGAPTSTDSHYQHSVQSYLIGHIDAVGPGAVYLEVGDMGIVEFNSPPWPGDEIELGFGDDLDHIRGGHYAAASSIPEATLVCVGDLNGDNTVDTADLGSLISAFGTNAPHADINGDGVVDTADLGGLISRFGTGCIGSAKD
jgi:hypothetical protein